MNAGSRTVLIAAVICAVPSRALPATKGSVTAAADTVGDRIRLMQRQINQLQKQLNTLRRRQAKVAEKAQAADRTAQAAKAAAKAKPQPKPLTAAGRLGVVTRAEVASQLAALQPVKPAKPADHVKLGGAVRFQYSLEGSKPANRHRHGDLDFDMFAVNVDASVKRIELSAQYRFYQYMNVIHHAWVGYRFSGTSEARAGITRLPFGVLPYDSHNYFFSSNYYLGLEDSYRTGVKYLYTNDPWNVQLAFFKNDSSGGVDGFVSNRADSYSYNIVGARMPGEGVNDDPQHALGTTDTAAARIAYTLQPQDGVKVELGLSGLRGGLDSLTGGDGYYDAYAAHVDATLGRWNLQLQAARYHYLTHGGAQLMAVGAYDFYDSIAARADTFTGNVAYALPVSLGPVSLLTFYTDSSLVNDKSGDLRSTWMNVSGMSLTAGDVFSYFDFVTARNQPFIGGSMAGDGGVNHRFNINVGYYF